VLSNVAIAFAELSPTIRKAYAPQNWYPNISLHESVGIENHVVYWSYPIV